MTDKVKKIILANNPKATLTDINGVTFIKENKEEIE